jgi:hypothetical protein
MRPADDAALRVQAGIRPRIGPRHPRTLSADAHWHLGIAAFAGWAESHTGDREVAMTMADGSWLIGAAVLFAFLVAVGTDSF